jgi:hypothetical protein
MENGWNRAPLLPLAQRPLRCNAFGGNDIGRLGLRIISVRVWSKHESEVTTYEIQTCCFIGRAGLRGSHGPEVCASVSDRHRDRRSTLLHSWSVVLESWGEMVLDSGTLGLAPPSSGLDPRPLRAPVTRTGFRQLFESAARKFGRRFCFCDCSVVAAAVAISPLNLFPASSLL